MTDKTTKKKRVLVALSGGVDSAVAAARLVDAGHDVVGVFLHFWADPEFVDAGGNRCCSLAAREDARKVARQLGINFYTLNFDQPFRRAVVKRFLDGAARGLTYNPCVFCNRDIKFGRLLQKARALDCDILATGHYAQIKKPRSRTVTGRQPSQGLFQGKDPGKDQTYFLYNLTPAQLARVVFPVGSLTKKQVRAQAKKMGLAVATKPESQNLCFTDSNKLDDFLLKYLPRAKPGPVKLVNGQEIGQHRGLPLYTIGQRKGLGFGYTAPLYVVGTNRRSNTLIVTDDERDPGLWARGLEVKSINWTIGQQPLARLKFAVRVRYQQPAINLRKWSVNTKGVLRAEFTRPLRAVTAGQAAVFYRGRQVLGGGIIAGSR